MKYVVFFIMALSATLSFATVKEKKSSRPEVSKDLDVSSVKAELLDELNQAPEDLDFDTDEQLSNDSTFEDAEIERIAQAEKEEAAANNKDSKSNTKK